MSKDPLIGGRFEYNPEEGTLTIEFTSGRRVVLGPEQEAGFERVLRGEVPLTVTGGKACARSKLNWAQQLEGQMDIEVRRAKNLLTPEPKQPKVKRYDKRGNLELSLEDMLSTVDLTSLLADIKKKEDAK